MKKLALLSGLTILLGASACGDDGGDGEEEFCGHGVTCPETQTSAVLDLTQAGFPAVAGSEIELRRYEGTPNKVEVDISATLEAGHVYTVWWVFFNAPENCVTHPGAAAGELHCGPNDFPDAQFELVEGAFGYAGPSPGGGAVADESTGEWTVTTRTFLEGNVDEENFFPGGMGGEVFKQTLDDYLGEIHVVLRDHGVALTGTDLDAQLGEGGAFSYNGGCPPNECADTHGAAFPEVIPE